MNRQEFIRERMKGNPLNQFDMTKDGYHNYLRNQTSILWFVEFPDGSVIWENLNIFVLKFGNNGNVSYLRNRHRNKKQKY